MLKRLTCLILLAFYLYCLSGKGLGFALSGGGARGFAQIGMLKVLEEAGIQPDYISGTSIGALIGGLYAIGYNAVEIESIFVHTDWQNIFSDEYKREDLYIGQKRWAPYGNAVFRLNDSWQPQLPQSVLIGNRINLDLFKLFAPASDINDFNKLPIPFSAIATNLITGELTVFTSGSLMKSIRASMSIPSILQPFPCDGTLYIDGGLSQNLPGRQVKNMGADYVIGLKVNSTLQPENKMNNLINVLDQTINIGMTNKLNEQLTYCDYILEPDLEQFSASDFKNTAAIIHAGESYAREHILDLINLKNRLLQEGVIDSIGSIRQKLTKTRFRFSRINVNGNKYLSAQIIREYTGLHTNIDYTYDDVVNGVSQAWNSQLFEIIYPVLERSDNSYLLKLYVKEMDRKHLIVNLSYDSDNEFMAGIVVSLQNYFLKNSNLLAEVKLGGKNELNLDFVKNFGQAYGIYYRLYPYLDEKRIYFYNNEHDKITSARSLEYGLTTGIGLFARKSVVLEGYGFSYKTKLYREISISDTLERSIYISGIGFKAYHESLDDYYFPLSGTKALVKASFSNDDFLSERSMSKLKTEYSIYSPITHKVSILTGLSIGSHFKNSSQSSYDPYYIGGLDGFAGIPLYEKSAPFYELIQGGVTYNPMKNFFLTSKVQALNFSDVSTLVPEDGFEMAGVLEVGFRTYLGPIKLAIAVAERNIVQYYLNFGYTSDIFSFSRR